MFPGFYDHDLAKGKKQTLAIVSSAKAPACRILALDPTTTDSEVRNKSLMQVALSQFCKCVLYVWEQRSLFRCSS